MFASGFIFRTVAKLDTHASRDTTVYPRTVTVAREILDFSGTP